MKQKNDEILAEILEKVDPMEAAIMILGGTAAVSGIVPPMTRLLLTFVGGDSTGAANMTKDLTTAQSTLSGFIAASVTGIPWLIPLSLLFRVPSGSGGGSWSTTDEGKAQVAAVGLFASGAIEAMIMYKLVSNPDVMKALIALPGQVITAAGNAVPAVLPV